MTGFIVAYFSLALLVALIAEPALARVQKPQHLGATIIKVDRKSREFGFVIVRDERGQNHQIACEKTFFCRYKKGRKVQIVKLANDDFWRILT